MGRLRFSAPGLEALLVEAASRAYVAGLEGIPWETVCTVIGDQLLVDRDTSESGTVSIPWQVRGLGQLMLTTSNLMERAEPYLLPLELARGTINRLRNQSSAWQQAGLVLGGNLEKEIHKATVALARAATSQHEPDLAIRQADQALRIALDALEQLGEQYSQQALTARRQAGPLPTLLACRLEETPEGKAAKKILDAFNCIVIPFTWRTVEAASGEPTWEQFDALIDWANQHNLKVCGGPLIHLDERSLPDWIYLWDEDWEELETYILGHVSAVVRRYQGRVHLWNIAARVNVDAALKVDEEQVLRLTVDAIETVRSLDARTPAIVSFDQPWSEHLAEKDRDLPPMHFADTLARAELGVAGFGLELNWGYWPGGTPLRDTVELSRLIDRWTVLGHPLLVSLVAPSSAQADSQARHPARPQTEPALDIPSTAWQRQVVDRLLPVLLAKNSVQAIVWNQWTDTHPHEFMHGGLIDASGKAKSALKGLKALRQKYLS
jgi:hypothetical protein